jgi:GMP synthase PP-ATPase subunit
LHGFHISHDVKSILGSAESNIQAGFVIKESGVSGDGQIEDHDWALPALEGVDFLHGQLVEAERRVVAMIKGQILQVSPELRFVWYKDNDILW